MFLGESESGLSPTRQLPDSAPQNTLDLQKSTLKNDDNDHRHNAAIIVECSNVIPFKYTCKGDRFICTYCPKSSTEFSVIKKHALSESHNKISANTIYDKRFFLRVEVTDLKCEICSESIKDVEKLFDHLIEKHDKPLVKEYGIGVMPFLLSGPKYNCLKCDKSFKGFTGLTRHVNIHYANTICSLCGKSFSDAKRMENHMQIHLPPNEHKCSKCDMTFRTKVEKQKHLATHKFKHHCSRCNEAFMNYSLKLDHLVKFHGKKAN